MAQMFLIIGFMASGKSTSGATAAAQLGLKFYDLDQLVERNSGRKIADIFAQSGENEFRRLEHSFFADLLQGSSSPAIIAAGGGLPTYRANHTEMEKCRVIFLDTPWQVMQMRIEEIRDSRPLLHGKSMTEIKKLWQDRRPVYLKHAEFVIQEGDQISGLVSKIIAGATK